MILLVSYDLQAPNKNYDDLCATLKTAESWWHYLKSTWILYTNDSVDAWQKKIKAVVDNNDNFIVVDITCRTRNGWLPKKAWEWIRNHENSQSKRS